LGGQSTRARDRASNDKALLADARRLPRRATTSAASLNGVMAVVFAAIAMLAVVLLLTH
jgi:hypothetical protein